MDEDEKVIIRKSEREGERVKREGEREKERKIDR